MLWQWPFHVELDTSEKIITSIAGLIAIGETARRLLLRYLRRTDPPELRKFSMAEHLDYKHRRSSKPALFRFAGPLAADFERGYVHLRREGDQLLKRLPNESPIAVIGSPAAGKTVVLRSLGYNILKSRRFRPLKQRAVYLISLKEAAVQEPELEKLKNLPKSAVVIVDDCHLDRTFTERLIAPPTPECRIILFSRPLDFPPIAPRNRSYPGVGHVSKDEFGPAHESPLRAIFDSSRALEVKATEAASKIVALYSEKTGLEIEQKVQSDIVNHYGRNLMVLTWALETFRRDNTFERAEVSRTAANWLLPEFASGEGFYRDLRQQDRREIHSNDAAVIFLVLASTYRFEFAIARDFLQHDLQVKRDHIDLLVKSRMLTAEHDEIGLPHSSLASLFVEAASTTPLAEIVRAIELRLKATFPDGVLRSYVDSRPEQTCNLLSRIPQSEHHAVRTVVENNESTIRRCIMTEQTLYKITGAIHAAGQVNKMIAKNILEEDPVIIDVLGKKLHSTPMNWESSEYVNTIASASRSVATALVPYVEAQIRAATVDLEMGTYINRIANAHEDIAEALVPLLLKKLRDSDYQHLGHCVGEIGGFFRPSAAGMRIARRLLPIVREKILQSSGYEPIISVIVGMAWRENNELALELVSSIAQRLNAEPTRVVVGTVVLIIADEVSQPLAKAIYDSLSPEAQAILHEISRNPPNEKIRSSVEKAALWTSTERT